MRSYRHRACADGGAKGGVDDSRGDLGPPHHRLAPRSCDERDHVLLRHEARLLSDLRLMLPHGTHDVQCRAAKCSLQLCLTHGVDRHGPEVWVLGAICLAFSDLGLHGMHGNVVVIVHSSFSSGAFLLRSSGTNCSHREHDPGALLDIQHGAKGSACGRLDGPRVGERQVDGHENRPWIRELLRNSGTEVIDRALP